MFPPDEVTTVIRTTNLLLSLSGPDPEGIVRALERAGLTPEDPDFSLSVDHEDQKGTVGWLDTWLPKARTFNALDNAGRSITFDRAGIVTLSRPDTEVSVPGLFETLDQAPFELAVIGKLFREWRRGYPTYSFGDRHGSHGFACAFRGAGYDRLVSRRWLDFGPWRTLAVGDATWVMFHDFEAEPSVALDQALPGWERMGISDTGGFIQTGFVYTENVGGVYDPTEKKLKVMVPSGEVSQRKMLEIAAARRDPRVQSQVRVERTAFVFLDEASARRHLHELWLREHECWAIVDGDEHRLDSTYQPTPPPPPW